MTSNEDAGTGYKPLKRVSLTPLYYPLAEHPLKRVADTHMMAPMRV